MTFVAELRDSGRLADWSRQTIFILQGKKRNLKKLCLPKCFSNSASIIRTHLLWENKDCPKADGSLSIHSHRAEELLAHNVFLGQTQGWSISAK